MANKATKAQATEAGFETAVEYNAFLDANETDHDSYMSSAEDSEGVVDGGEDTATHVSATVPYEPRKDLSPEAVGFTASEVKDVDPEDLPDFSLSGSKYSEYFKEIQDSYNRTQWKLVSGITDPEGLAAALRNAASRINLGIEVKVMRDLDKNPTGDVYFLGRDRRPKNDKGESNETD